MVVSNATISFTHLTQANSHITSIVTELRRDGCQLPTEQECATITRKKEHTYTSFHVSFHIRTLQNKWTCVLHCTDLCICTCIVERNGLKTSYNCNMFRIGAHLSNQHTDAAPCMWYGDAEFSENEWHNVFFWQTALFLSFYAFHLKCLSYAEYEVRCRCMCRGENKIREYEFLFVTNVRTIFYNVSDIEFRAEREEWIEKGAKKEKQPEIGGKTMKSRARKVLNG